MDEENKELIKVVTNEEIYSALSQINSLRAPGLDGLMANFYKKILKNSWQIIL